MIPERICRRGLQSLIPKANQGSSMYPMQEWRKTPRVVKITRNDLLNTSVPTVENKKNLLSKCVCVKKKRKDRNKEISNLLFI